MEINKAYKFRLYPNKNQRELFSKQFGCVRFVWNHFLDLRKSDYTEHKKSRSYHKDCKDLTEFKKENEFLKEVNSQSLQHSLRNLDTAYDRFFRKIAKFPNFKKKNHKNSFHIPQNFNIIENKIHIPKVKDGIKFKKHQRINGIVKNLTISKTSTNKYFVSILVEEDYQPLKTNKNTIGIDLGIKTFATFSDGQKIDNPKWLRKNQNKLKYNQRQLSKKTKGSNARNKYRLRVAIIHEKIKNQRLDFLHKLTFNIVRENQAICAESLKVKNMMKNHNLARAIGEVSWAEFFRQLDYKSNWNNRQFVQIEWFFPSSKMCNNCGYINQNLKLSDREWVCENCKTKLDRDINASKNILNQGLKILSGCALQSDKKQKEQESSVCNPEAMNAQITTLSGGS